MKRLLLIALLVVAPSLVFGQTTRFTSSLPALNERGDGVYSMKDIVFSPDSRDLRWAIGGTGTDATYPKCFWSGLYLSCRSSGTAPRSDWQLYGSQTTGAESDGAWRVSAYEADSDFGLQAYYTDYLNDDIEAFIDHTWWFKAKNTDSFFGTADGLALPVGNFITFTDDGALWDEVDYTRITPATPSGTNVATLLPLTGDIEIQQSSEGTCNAAAVGQIAFVQGGAGVFDTYRICAKDDSDVYDWRSMFVPFDTGLVMLAETTQSFTGFVATDWTFSSTLDIQADAGMTLESATFINLYTPGGEVDIGEDGDTYLNVDPNNDTIFSRIATGIEMQIEDGTVTFGDGPTEDQIVINPIANGGTANAGTITTEDLTGARTWTLPNETGEVGLMQKGTSTLTESSATSILSFPILDTEVAYGTLSLMPYCSDGAGNWVILHQTYDFVCTNDAGSESCDVGVYVGAAPTVGSSGSFTAHSLTPDYTGTNQVTWQITATCTIAQTVLEENWEIEFHHGGIRPVVTEEN